MAPTTSSTTAQSLKERQRQEREQLILQAAEELLIENGYHETSIDQIATKVGVSKGTVYLHFQSKEELVMALFERDRKQFLQSVETILTGNGLVVVKTKTPNDPRQETETILTGDGSPRERLQALLTYIFSGLIGRHFQLLMIMFQSPELRSRLAGFAEKKGRERMMWGDLSERVAQTLEEGKACGEFDTTMPTPVMAAMFTSLLNPHSFARLIDQEHMEQQAAVEQICRFFFKGIAADKPHEP
ncbi:MAG TPA: TetR/AcrR family transcriptional regulator [Ktedonobacterales bacterium]|nr:TetR/AcrR family transcriptional regulator [Ktedonobacterales bacterium]